MGLATFVDDTRNPTGCLGSVYGPPFALWFAMSTNNKTKKLQFKPHTIRTLTREEMSGAVGGITGAVLNPTGGDSRGITLSIKWYAAKWTIGNK
jgi:hypothetical protein